jgi:hypothetical protein
MAMLIASAKLESAMPVKDQRKFAQPPKTANDYNRATALKLRRLDEEEALEEEAFAYE